MEEITATREERELRTMVYFLDDTFEELLYDMTTTVAAAIEKLAETIKLKHYQTFTLYEQHRMMQPQSKSLPNFAGGTSSENGSLYDTIEESIVLDDTKYIADIVYDMKSTARNSSKSDPIQTRLLLKKRLFRDSDEDVKNDPVFLNLSYVQAVHDYMLGLYPTGRDETGQISAYQLHVDEGPYSDGSESAFLADLQFRLSKYIPKSVLASRRREEWSAEILGKWRAIQSLTTDEARKAVLSSLCSLPYGNSTFYAVKRLEDPVGLLPGRVILGVNGRGVHFFRPVPREYLHSAELRDIMQFGSSQSAVFFKMRVASRLHIFQFETRQGEDICLSLQTYINDIMNRRRARKLEQQAAQGVESSSHGGGAADKHVFEMKRVLEEAQKQIETLTQEKQALENKASEMKEVAAEAEDRKLAEEHERKEAVAYAERLQQETNELMMKLAEQEKQLSRLSAPDQSDALAAREKEHEESVAASVELQRDIVSAKETIRTLETQLSKAKKDQEVAESKANRISTAAEQERSKREAMHNNALKELRTKVGDKDEAIARLTGDVQKLAQQISQHKSEDEIRMEVESEFSEFKEDAQRKEVQLGHTIDLQAKALAELEKKYLAETVLRKKYFNTIEDMKGKVRVFARCRPLSSKETNESAENIIFSPDEYTVEHPWKDDKKKQYTFDFIFGPSSTQDDVFEDCKYLVQSACDGYNVCVFAYGQTGSGKTFTIFGNEENPGLQPRAMSELWNIIDRDSGKFSFSLEVYMLELYQDNLIDLLAPNSKSRPRLDIKKDSKGMVYVQGATLLPASSLEELNSITARGAAQRHVAGTKMNVESSRSHLILSIVIKSINLQTQAESEGKLSFIDLAGSERVKKSGSSGEQLKEAQSINKSLSALADVISALGGSGEENGKGPGFVPYRNHKLTMLMSDSLGGNAKTLMFVNISPAGNNLDETHNSLCYATRARNIVNDATKNIANKEVLRLKKQVAYWKEQAGIAAQKEVQEIDNCRQGPVTLAT